MREFVRFAAFFAAHLLLAGFAKSLAITPGTGISLWGPNGLTLGILLNQPRQNWWKWLSIGVASEAIANCIWFHDDWHVALVITFGNATEIIVAALAVRYFKKHPTSFADYSDVLQFVIWGAVFAPVFGALIGGTVLSANGDLTLAKAFSLFWIGDATGIVLVTPLVLIGAEYWDTPVNCKREQVVELAAVMCLVAVILATILMGLFPNASIVLPALLWLSVRFGFVGAATSLITILAIAALVIWVQYFWKSEGAFPTSIKPTSIQLSVFSAAIAVLLVASLSNQNQTAVRELRAANAHLEQRVEERTRHLRASEAVFRSLGESSPDFLWMTDGDGNPIYQNIAWRSFTGLDNQGLVSSGWETTVHAQDLPRLRELWSRALETGEAFETEYRCRKHDGTYEWMLGRTAPILDENGKVTKWIGTSSNINRIKAIESQLQLADQKKNEFLATLAHELRNPLAPIRFATSSLKTMGSIQVDALQAVEIIDRQVRTMARLIDDLMDVSRIQEGKIQIRLEPVSLGAILAVAIEGAQPLLDERTHSFDFSMPNRDLIVNGDEVRLTQVFLNLLNNAAKFTEPRGRIRLIAYRECDDAVVSISDSGHGIAPNNLAAVFEMFCQLPTAPGRAKSGLGIGLGLVRTLVEMHGGTVTAASDGIEMGSTFTVRLPVSTDVAVGVREPNSRVTLDVPSQSIVIIEDNADAAWMLSKFLETKGHKAAIANNGIDGINLVRNCRPVLVLCDIGLPDMDGYELCRTLRADVAMADVTLVALTGWGQENDKRRAFEAGFDQHMTKPVDAAAILELMRSISEKSLKG